MAQQQRDAQIQLRAEASVLAAQTSTQLNAEFRRIDLFRMSSMESKCRSSQFMLRRHLLLKDDLYVQEAGEEIRRNENASGTLVNYLESQL